MANHIEARAIRLRQESLSRLIITFAGTQASGFVKFIVNAFGSSKEMSEAEASELIRIPGEGGDEEDDEEEVVLSTKDPSAPVANLPDVCSLADSKPAYPVSSVSLSSTGVPVNLYSENMPMGASKRSTYYCLYGEPCNVYTHQKASITSHLRRKHLGSSVACRFCDERWWTTAPFTKHMEKKHPEVEAPSWWTPVDLKKAAAEEESAAKETSAEVTSTAATPLM